MFNRILSLPLAGPHSILLRGPYGVGKTSWIKSKISDCVYVDLEAYNTFGKLFAQPDRLETLIPSSFTGWIVIDEVQRIPELFDEVHYLIEQRKLRFLLIASSIHSLRKKKNHPLLGKTLNYAMHPLTMQEIGGAVSISTLVQYGFLPRIFDQEDPTTSIERYVQRSISDEVASQGLTRDMSGFVRFLERVSFYQGSVLNVSELARELSLNRLMVARYIDILEDLLLVVRIRPFNLHAKKKIIAHQKVYFFDTGVYNSIYSMGSENLKGEMAGAALQTIFLQSARAINDYYALGYTFYFWQTFAGTEVPFIMSGPHGLHAFALTHSSVSTSKLVKGLRSFKKDYPEAQTYLLYAGKQREMLDTHSIIPFFDALNDLPLLLSAQFSF